MNQWSELMLVGLIGGASIIIIVYAILWVISRIELPEPVEDSSQAGNSIGKRLQIPKICERKGLSILPNVSKNTPLDSCYR